MCCGVWFFSILADKDIYQSSNSPSDLDFGLSFAFCFHSIPIIVSQCSKSVSTPSSDFKRQ